MSIYLPSALGCVGKKGKPGKADEIFEEFISRYPDNNNADIERPNIQGPGIKRNYQLRVVLFTQARKQDPNKEPFQQDEEAEQIIQKRSRKYDRAKHKGLLQYWTGNLEVKASGDIVICQQRAS